MKLVCAIALFVFGLSSASAEDDLRLYDWPFGVDVFKSQEVVLEKAIGRGIEFRLVPFPIAENTEEAFVYDEKIDVVGMFSSSVPRLREAGWIENLSAHEELSNAVDKMYKNVAKAVRFDDDIYGIGQVFVGLNVPFVDMDVYQSLGFTREDFPKDWAGLTDQMVLIADKHLKNFYLPYWFDRPSGLPTGFLIEVVNRGGNLINPEGGGVYMQELAGPAFDTLVDWRRLMNAGAVDTSVLTMSYPEFKEAFMESDFLFSGHLTSDLLRAKTAKRNGHRLSLLPASKTNWGMIGAQHFAVSYRDGEDEETRAAKRNLLLQYTRGSGDLKFAVARKWLETTGSFSVFQDYMEGAEAQQIVREKLSYPEDAEVLMELLEKISFPETELRVVWKHEYFSFMHKELKAYLMDPKVKPQTVIKNLNSKIVSLRRLYGY